MAPSLNLSSSREEQASAQDMPLGCQQPLRAGGSKYRPGFPGIEGKESIRKFPHDSTLQSTINHNTVKPGTQLSNI
jgi:hypothetical protein